jgi:O-succinylbenzoic acid--CoA ligase
MDRAQLIAVLRATGCAEERGGFVFLVDPARRAAVPQSRIENSKSKISSGWLCVATGGSGGELKFARHDEQTLLTAVRGFCAHFDLARVNAVDVLPPFHVSGLMARVRCAATDGRHVPCDWKRLETGERPALAAGAPWVISLVPTQLHRLLAQPAAVSWLRGFAIIFVGGGPLWPELADAAAQAGLRLAPSYGLTETAAMVAALRPEEFLAGRRSCGTPLRHAKLSITPEGLVRVGGDSVFRGYFPSTLDEREFATEDLARIDERGHLHILGRRDAIIISGGKKIRPETVEAALRASGEFSDVAVVGVPDAEWGEIVVACYPAGGQKPDVARAGQALAAHERPKRCVPIEDWPRNAQGKVSRPALRAALVK